MQVRICDFLLVQIDGQTNIQGQLYIIASIILSIEEWVRGN